MFRLFLLSGNHVASINSFAECGVHRPISEWPIGRHEGKDRVIIDLQKRVEELSPERREADGKLVKLQTNLDCELAAWQGQEGELDRL